MLEQELFNFILKTANDQAETDVNFKGNYALIVVGGIAKMVVVSQYNAFDTVEENFVPMAETVGNEIAFVEENNRSDWSKQFAFKFRGEEKDRVLQSLQNLRDYLFTNPQVTITDDTTDYKFRMKCSRPTFSGSQSAQGGDVELIYVIQIDATSVVTGFFADDITYKMSVQGGTLQSIITDTVITANETAHDISNDITSEANAKSVPIGRAILNTVDMQYDGTALSKLIYSICNGVASRETEFDFQEVFDGVTFDYVVTIAKNSKARKKGTLVSMTLSLVEV